MAQAALRGLLAKGYCITHTCIHYVHVFTQLDADFSYMPVQYYMVGMAVEFYPQLKHYIKFVITNFEECQLLKEQL